LTSAEHLADIHGTHPDWYEGQEEVDEIYEGYKNYNQSDAGKNDWS
jgi:hypothetical protein